MPDRKYSVAEIDSMRKALWDMYPTGVGYYKSERNEEVELRLRTYMLNGTDPSELQQAAREAQEADRGNRRVFASDGEVSDGFGNILNFRFG